MPEMEKPKEMITSLIEKGEEYGKTTLELLKLKTVDKSADIVSTLVSWMIVIALAILFFTVANIGIAFWLGDLIGETYLGFLTVAGFYGFLTLIFWIFRKPLVKKPLNNSIVEKFLD